MRDRARRDDDGTAESDCLSTAASSQSFLAGTKRPAHRKRRAVNQSLDMSQGRSLWKDR